MHLKQFLECNNTHTHTQYSTHFFNKGNAVFAFLRSLWLLLFVFYECKMAAIRLFLSLLFYRCPIVSTSANSRRSHR
jgi:hypothetical protein